MSAFLTHIINRHAQVENMVQPRPRSLFEPPPAAPPISEPLLPSTDEPLPRVDQTDPATNQTAATPPDPGQPPKTKPRPAGPDKVPPVKGQPPAKREYPRTTTSSLPHRKQVWQGSPEPPRPPVPVEAMSTVQKVRELSGKTPGKPEKPRRIAATGKGPLQAENPHEKTFSPKRIEPAGAPEPLPQPDALPTVKIHIGRIEIRAVQEKSEKPHRTTGTPKPKMSLDQFLKDREG